MYELCGMLTSLILKRIFHLRECLFSPHLELVGCRCKVKACSYYVVGELESTRVVERVAGW